MILTERLHKDRSTILTGERWIKAKHGISVPMLKISNVHMPTLGSRLDCIDPYLHGKEL